MANLCSNDILPIIHTYLIEIGMQSVAKKLEKFVDFDLHTFKNGISSKKLKKICKFYLKHHPKVQKITQNANLKEVIANDEEKIEEKTIEIDLNENTFIKNKAKKLEHKKKESESNEEEEEILSTNELENNENFDDIDKNKKNTHSSSLIENSKKIVKKPFFQRIDHSRVENLKPELKDNTFMAKFKFGGGDDFGKIGHERLKDARGRNFKKEKSKMKNKQFQGGGFKIDIQARNAIKL